MDFWCAMPERLLLPPDQHFHDPPVQLWERPPGPVHLCQPCQLYQELHKPEAADAAPRAAGSEVLPALPRADRPPLAGKVTSSSSSSCNLLIQQASFPLKSLFQAWECELNTVIQWLHVPASSLRQNTVSHTELLAMQA